MDGIQVVQKQIANYDHNYKVRPDFLLLHEEQCLIGYMKKTKGGKNTGPKDSYNI